MKNRYKLGIIASVAACIALASCDFKSPLEDGNGDNINLVRLDLPLFDARYMMKLVDMNGEPVDATVELSFNGVDAENLITEAGKMVMKPGEQNNPVYKGYRTTVYGMLNLNLNPNFKVASHPVSFQINGAEQVNPNYIVLPKLVSQTVAGDVNIEVTVVRLTQNYRAARISDEVTVSGSGVSKVMSLSGQNGNGYDFVALYKSTQTGSVTCVDNTGNLGDYGIYLLNEPMKTAPARTKTIDSGRYYILVKKAKQVVEGKVKIDVKSQHVGVSTSLAYTVITQSGKVIDRGSISGVLPFTTTIEQLFVSPQESQVTVKLEGNATYVVTPQTKTATISNTSTSTVDFSVVYDKQNLPNLQKCNISFVGICSTNKQIAFYPSIRFQYSVQDSKRWEWAESKAGKLIMMLEPNTDYSIRIPINNEWQKFNITTNQAKINAIVREQPNVTKFELVNLQDGSMNLKAEYQSQEFCDLNL